MPTVNFERLTWEDYPSENTPINAENLNRLEEGVAGLYHDISTIEGDIEEHIEDIETAISEVTDLKDDVTTSIGEITSDVNAFKIKTNDKVDEVKTFVHEEMADYVTDWLDDHVTPTEAPVVIDDSLSISGAAADAKAAGDGINDLKSAIKTITDNEVAKFVIGKYINTSGNTADIDSPTTNATYRYAVLDCSEGDVFTITGTGGNSPRLFAFLGAESNGSRPIIEKANEGTTLTNKYITAPANSEKLVVNVSKTYPYLLIVGKHIINLWNDVQENETAIERIGQVIIFPNLTDPSQYASGYKTNAGTTGSNTTYKYTGKFHVSYGDTVYFTKRCRYVCAFNVSGNVVSASGADASTINYYVVPEGITEIQVTFYSADEAGFMATTIEGQEYVSYGTPIIDGDYIPHYDNSSKYIELKSKSNYYKVSDGSMSANDYLLIDKLMPVKNGTVIQFSGNITGTFSGIEIGFTSNISQSDTSHFKIDSQKIYRVTSNPAETAHGLTISGNLSVTITQTYTHLMVDITCNGEKYHYGSGWAPLNMKPYVKVLSAMTDCVLSWTASKNKKNIIVFGDSYVSYGESRWVYYLDQNGYGDNVTICGYSGEGSSDGYQNFLDLMPVMSAQYIVWAYGMNDHDSSSAANATWKEKIDSVISYCNNNGMVPVLCTIPNVPSYSNNYKNTYVRSLADRYPVIDFAKAVGSDVSSSWYEGMLSTDNVHPTASGAMALYNRAIADFPQLCVDN